jgi:hypothetical protein
MFCEYLDSKVSFWEGYVPKSRLPIEIVIAINQAALDAAVASIPESSASWSACSLACETSSILSCEACDLNLTSLNSVFSFLESYAMMKVVRREVVQDGEYRRGGCDG